MAKQSFLTQIVGLIPAILIIVMIFIFFKAAGGGVIGDILGQFKAFGQTSQDKKQRDETKEIVEDIKEEQIKGKEEQLEKQREVTEEIKRGVESETEQVQGTVRKEGSKVNKASRIRDAKIRAMIRKQGREADKAKMKDITQKYERGEKLTPAEIGFLARQGVDVSHINQVPKAKTVTNVKKKITTQPKKKVVTNTAPPRTAPGKKLTPQQKKEKVRVKTKAATSKKQAVIKARKKK